jgi:hypothetical protein
MIANDNRAVEEQCAISLVLGKPPSLNSMWRIGPRGPYKSKEYKAWLDDSLGRLANNRPPPISGKYILEVYIRRPDNRRRDLDNVAFKAVSDFLVKAGLIRDDSDCVRLVAEWRDDGPETLVNVYPVGN